jgi:3-hydroxyacyl-CoA dehydrogenase
MIPLVEVVGGNKTSSEVIQQAIAFYASIGKKSIYLRKEFPGHAANRLQAALYREALYLIQQGVLSVEEVLTFFPRSRRPSLIDHWILPAQLGHESYSQSL